jgi:hypothetical protein
VARKVAGTTKAKYQKKQHQKLAHIKEKAK